MKTVAIFDQGLHCNTKRKCKYIIHTNCFLNSKPFLGIKTCYKNGYKIIMAKNLHSKVLQKATSCFHKKVIYAMHMISC